MSVKIAISGHGKKVSVKFKDDDFESCLGLMKEIAALIDKGLSSVQKTAESVPNITSDSSDKSNITEVVDFVRGSKRLPNTSVVDVSSIDLKRAASQDTLIRCPHCGQSHCTIIGTHQDTRVLLKKNYKGKDSYYPAIGTDNMSHKQVLSKFTLSGLINDKIIEGTDEVKNKFEFYTIMNSVNVVKEDFNADADTLLLCPVCGEEEPLSKWVDAYVNPLKYFETENICEVCGGELVVIEHTERGGMHDKVTVMECEDCGGRKTSST